MPTRQQRVNAKARLNAYGLFIKTLFTLALGAWLALNVNVKVHDTTTTTGEESHVQER